MILNFLLMKYKFNVNYEVHFDQKESFLAHNLVLTRYY